MEDAMTAKRNIEVFSAGCPLCDDAVALVENVAGSSHAITVLDLREEKVPSRARALGVRSVPAVVVDGDLLDCCEGRGISQQTLRRRLEEETAAEEPSSHKGCC